MPDVGIQIPPNLSDWWSELVEAGATDLGGLSANGDHISPEHAFPSPHQVRKELAPKGFALTERLCVYPQYMDPNWMEQGVLDVIKLKYWSFIPRSGSGRRVEEEIDPGLAERAIARGREGAELSEDELTALFAETRPQVIEEMRAAADELRAELAGDRVTFVVNRNINFTNICVVGCAFCGFGQGKRSPDAYEVSEEDFAERIGEAVDFGATEICMQGGIHPDLTLEEYGKWLRLAKQVAPQLHLHAYSPMEVHYMCERSGKEPEEVFEYLLECGLGSTPGTAAEVLDDGVRQRISPNKLPVGRWVEIIEASHRAGLRSTSTVMFGHIEEPRELARHMRVVRELQERTGGITEFVPLSFIPFNTMLGRTHGIEEIGADENLKHTAAFRLALGRTIPNLQASWVKMGLGAATEALRWGVNDLGGTLMEENISRMAGSQHGVRLESRAADRGGPCRRARTGAADDPLRDRRDLRGSRRGLNAAGPALTVDFTTPHAWMARVARRLAEKVLLARAEQGGRTRAVRGCDVATEAADDRDRDAAVLVAGEVGGRGGTRRRSRSRSPRTRGRRRRDGRASRREGSARRNRSRRRPGRAARPCRSCRR